MAAVADTQSIVTGPRSLFPYVAFATEEGRFTPLSSDMVPITQSEETMRVMVVQLGQAEWGLVVSEIDSVSSPQFTFMIDTTFWFYANELVGTLQFARHSTIPHGDWTSYQVRLANGIDFADCARAVADAKADVLYHRARSIDALVAVYERQFPTTGVTVGNTASTSPSPLDLSHIAGTAAGPVAAAAAAASAVDSVPAQHGVNLAENGEFFSFALRLISIGPHRYYDLYKDLPDDLSRQVLARLASSMQPHEEIEDKVTPTTGIERLGTFSRPFMVTSVLRATRGLIMILAAVATVVRCTARIILIVLAFLKLPVVAFLAGLLSVSIVSVGFVALFRSAQEYLVTFDICQLPVVCSARDFTSFNLCGVPLAAVAFPSCRVLPVELAGRVDFPSLLAIQHRAFDELVAGSSTNSELVLNVKHAELAVRDLVVLVKASNLTTKEPLADALSLFSIDARRTGRGLQLLMSKIHGTVDRIAAYNAYALRVIDATQKVSAPGDPHVDAALVRTFQTSMASFSASISAIIVEATSVSANLDLLEERLLTIHALSAQEAFDTALAKDELLWQLWTFLGGNRRQMRELAHRASILQSVQQYRALASAYIAATVQSLSIVDADLTELREQLSIRAIGMDSIPVEVHIRSLEGSLMRLQDSRVGGKGLEGEVGRALEREE